ncbi:MAG: hypothetical protein QOG63_2346 [Thermoleophilaceae bacterium]|nr:hypothetical protein [Thermoleophilaceae bacterium]
MAGRIVLFGATGYTGRLVAAALVERGARPVLAGRNPDTLNELADELGGGFEVQAADVERPATVRELVEKGDVLVSTVGPFNRWGDAAVEAAVDAGVHYIDSTGEPPFIRRVFEEYGPRAQAAGCALVTAFGYDWVPGNLAGALVLDEAGERAAKVAVAYFMTGGGGSMSGGTAASAAGVMFEPGYAFRAGRVVGERPAKRVRSFHTGGRDRVGISIGSSEHYGLPAVYPHLREVDTYLGMFGKASRPLQVVTMAGLVPGVRPLVGALAGRFVKGSTGGPDAEARSKSGSLIAAEACDADGSLLASVELRGPNGYTFTGDAIAWGAATAAGGGLRGTGALGPVGAFGLEALEAGCAEIGLTRAG